MANTNAVGLWSIAEADPDFMAAVDPEHTQLTFGELAALANRVSRGLRAAEDRLSTDEVAATVSLIYGAGFETTASLIGSMAHTLMRWPDQLDRLRSDRSLVPSAVDEVLRFEPPVQVDGRYAFSDDAPMFVNSRSVRGVAGSVLRGRGCGWRLFRVRISGWVRLRGLGLSG